METTKMKVVCAWCKTVLEDGPGLISHGICKPCAKALDENKPVHWRVCPSCEGGGCGECKKGYLPVEWWEIGYANAIEDAP